jgi:hypothetical protein
MPIIVFIQVQYETSHTTLNQDHLLQMKFNEIKQNYTDWKQLHVRICTQEQLPASFKKAAIQYGIWVCILHEAGQFTLKI